LVNSDPSIALNTVKRILKTPPSHEVISGSMGGVVAQHFALRHPGRVLRLLLVATGAYTADPEGALAKADALPAASGHTPHLEEPEAFYRIALPFLLAGP